MWLGASTNATGHRFHRLAVLGNSSRDRCHGNQSSCLQRACWYWICFQYCSPSSVNSRSIVLASFRRLLYVRAHTRAQVCSASSLGVVFFCSSLSYPSSMALCSLYSGVCATRGLTVDNRFSFRSRTDLCHVLRILSVLYILHANELCVMLKTELWLTLIGDASIITP